VGGKVDHMEPSEQAARRGVTQKTFDGDDQRPEDGSQSKTRPATCG